VTKHPFTPGGDASCVFPDCGLLPDAAVHHQPQSRNGCVLCPALWSSHSAEARGEVVLSANPDEPLIKIVDQPPPIPNQRRAIVDLVIEDLIERKRVGIERYGTPLQAHNGRDSLVDLYQELQDAVLYVRQKIEEQPEPKPDGWHTYHICSGQMREIVWGVTALPKKEATCIHCGEWIEIMVIARNTFGGAQPLAPERTIPT
jgi:hypothetical protein